MPIKSIFASKSISLRSSLFSSLFWICSIHKGGAFYIVFAQSDVQQWHKNYNNLYVHPNNQHCILWTSNSFCDISLNRFPDDRNLSENNEIFKLFMISVCIALWSAFKDRLINFELICFKKTVYIWWNNTNNIFNTFLLTDVHLKISNWKYLSFNSKPCQSFSLKCSSL